MSATSVTSGRAPSQHNEHHFQSSDTVRDIVIGLADGLTVPFALAAGLAGAVSTVVNPAHIVVTAGLAEIAAGSIAMGLGGYLASRGDSEHFASERRREEDEIVTRPDDEAEEIYEVFRAYGVDRAHAKPVLESLQANPKAYVDFMMRFELGLEEPAPGRALRSALVPRIAPQRTGRGGRALRAARASGTRHLAAGDRRLDRRGLLGTAREKRRGRKQTSDRYDFFH